MPVVAMEIAGPLTENTTARDAGLVGCRRCARVWPATEARCGRCGGRLSSCSKNSLRKVWAWWGAGVIAYIPANIYPMLETRALFTRTDDTIIAGAIRLAEHGALGVAAVILLASVVIPLAKFFAVAYLTLSIRLGAQMSRKRQHILYEVVEFIGRWSMIDVFVVAILTSLVQFNFVASVKPGPASLAFALSVIFTMLAAKSFDSRLIWDQMPADQERESEFR